MASGQPPVGGTGSKQAIPLTGETNVELLLDQIRAKNIDDTKIAHEKKAMARRVGAPADFGRLTPGNKTKWMVNSTAPSILLDAFVHNGRELNVMWATQGSLRSVSSGIRSYANFCPARDRHWAPPTANAVKEWRANFNPRRTFQMYLRHLQKSAYLLCRPINWAAPAVTTISAGIEQHRESPFNSRTLSNRQTSLKY